MKRNMQRRHPISSSYPSISSSPPVSVRHLHNQRHHCIKEFGDDTYDQYQRRIHDRLYNKTSLPYGQCWYSCCSIFQQPLYWMLIISAFLVLIFTIYFWFCKSRFGVTETIEIFEAWSIYIAMFNVIILLASVVITGFSLYSQSNGTSDFNQLTASLQIEAFAATFYSNSVQFLRETQPNNPVYAQIRPELDLTWNKDLQQFVSCMLSKLVLTQIYDLFSAISTPLPNQIIQMRGQFNFDTLLHIWQDSLQQWPSTMNQVLHHDVIPYRGLSSTRRDPTTGDYLIDDRGLTTNHMAETKQLVQNSSLKTVVIALLIFVGLTFVCILYPGLFMWVNFDDADQTRKSWWTGFSMIMSGVLGAVTLLFLAYGFLVTVQAQSTQLNLTDSFTIQGVLLSGYPYTIPIAKGIDANNRELQLVPSPDFSVSPAEMDHFLFVQQGVCQGLIQDLWAELYVNRTPPPYKVAKFIQYFRYMPLVQFFYRYEQCYEPFQAEFVNTRILPHSKLAGFVY